MMFIGFIMKKIQGNYKLIFLKDYFLKEIIIII